MGWGVTAATLIGSGAAVISATIAAVAWRHRSEPAALPFTGLVVTLAAWSALYAVQLGYDTLAEQLVVQRLTLGVAGIVPTAWLLFALTYAGYESWASRRRVLVLLLEPAAFLALCVTNPLHEFVWTDASLTTTAVGSVSALAWGPAYAVHIVYAYLAVAAGIVLLFVLGGRVSRMYQRQVLLLVTGAMPPFLSHVAFTLGVSPVPALDLTPFLFAFTGVVFGLALFRFELLELAPVARVQSLEEMGDGLVVVDDQGVIVDLFGVAADVLEPTPHVGDPIEEVLPEGDLQALDGTDVTAVVDGRRRTYHLLVSSLRDHHDRQTGTMVVIRDITGLRTSEQRLRVSDRVLRHNLRNDMGVIQGYARDLESTLEGESARDARRILETAEGLLDLSEKARRITSLHERSGTAEGPFDVVPAVRDVVTGVRESHPAVTVSVELPDRAPIAGGDPEAFRTALRNLLENAVEHHDGDEPSVTVSVRRLADSVRVDVADDGPGLPDIERAVLAEGYETPLQHGQGLGLWLVYWCVRLLDGDLAFDAGGGTTVTMTFPAAAETVGPTE